jgi:Protein of unknown function (DUF3025)
LKALLDQIDLKRAPFHELTQVLAQVDAGLSTTEFSLAPFNASLSACLPNDHYHLRFAAQTEALLADGLSFEQRIAERGLIATRTDSLHDFYSALMWLRFPHSKIAIHQIHLAGIAAHGTKQRSRHQQAVTHVDEAGAFVACSNPALFELIGEHQWLTLFHANQSAWGRTIEVRVFGHALFEMLHAPHNLIAAKVAWVLVPLEYFELPAQHKDQLLDRLIAAALRDQRFSVDPKLLSTLPLSGIPGWWEAQDEDFYRTAPCFRPKPAGRVYSPALELGFLSLLDTHSSD